ncbi:MAG: hypothetical protein RMM98_00085 [Acidobacteriota bacterium]|nr:hypothetical protein [Blastocatellia bacterium]MDW8237989.1 hypothetical protein [Acidobacteriota bacterium]
MSHEHRSYISLYRIALWCSVGAIILLVALAPALWPAGPASADVDQASVCQFNRPSDVASDGVGNLYVSDTDNGRVVMISGGQARIVVGSLLKPWGLAVDRQRNLLYIAEHGRDRVLCVNLGNYAVSVCVSGILKQPTGLDVDTFGGLYIADTGNNRILYRAATGRICPVSPDPQFTLNRPHAVAVSLTDLFIADTGNNRIIRRNPGCDAAPASILATGAFMLNQPSDLVILTTGLYIADACHRVLRIDLQRITLPVAGGGVLGCQSGLAGDGGPAVLALLNDPKGLGSVMGSLLIADTGNNLVRQVDLLAGLISAVPCQ